jgi:hypothetical protein
MAISIISQPSSSRNAAYNPYKFVLDDSVNKTKKWFRYILTIEETNGTIYRRIVAPPDPLNNNYGTFDISSIVQERLNYTRPGTGITNASSSESYFNIRFGYSFVSDWSFTDYTWSSPMKTNLEGASCPFVVGDQITIQMNNTYTDNRRLLNGSFTVLEKPSSSKIVINIPFDYIGSFAASPGKASYADMRATEVYSGSVINSTAYNYAHTHLDYINNGGTVNKGLHTAMPNNFRLPYNEKVSLFGVFGSDTNKTVKLTSSNGATQTYTTAEITFYYNFKLSDMPGPIKANNPDWIKVEMYSDQTPTKSITIKLDYRCTPSDIAISFLDRKNSWGTFGFQLKNTTHITSDKKMYRTHRDAESTRAESVIVYDSDYSKVITLNTNWMTGPENIYFEQLMTSRHTLIKIDGIWRSCKVIDQEIETMNERFTKMIRKTIKVQLDENDRVN